MATIDECKKKVEYLAGKQGYNGYISPQDFNLLFASAERKYYNSLYESFLKNEDNSDSLSVHMSDPTLMMIDVTGKYAITDSVKHINAITHVYNGKQWPVERVEADRVANRLNSEYDAPDSQFPIYTRYKSHLQFYPENLANGLIVYLKKLVPAYWAYTLEGTAGRERPVYDPGNSTQPLWLEDDVDKLIHLVVSDIGLNMGDQNVQNFAERKIQTER